MTEKDWLLFREGLLGWYRPSRRPMPWKEHPDPYNVWLSEIILQQTRVEQGRAYYERFAATYPAVEDLAAAEDDAVMKLWEGLGYYSRARNLLKAARMVVAEHGGKFPDTYPELLKLPGVGPYTAAAIASFAFNRQVPVLDGNVYRVLSRFSGNATPIDTTTGKKTFGDLSFRALGDASAKVYNQAIMDFGALVCTPRRADCATCPVAKNCVALKTDTVYALPVKSKKLKKRDRFFHYLVVRDHSDRIVLTRRGEGDIWQALYQYPLVEVAGKDVRSEELPNLPEWPTYLPAGELEFIGRSQGYKQQLTHQTIYAVFHTYRWAHMPGSAPGTVITQNNLLENYAFPRVITRFNEDKGLLLSLF